MPPFLITGVTADATLVFGGNGTSGYDVIAAYIYRAASNGADITSLSLEGGPSLPGEYKRC